MLAAATVCLFGCVPQADASPTQPRIVTTPKGWPVPPASAPVEPATPATPRVGGERGPGAEPGGLAPLDRTTSEPAPAVPAVSPLLPVFRAVGTPADAATLSGVRASLRATLLDHRGATVGERTLVHEADLAGAARDRLVLAGDRIYGRDGQSVFAHYRNLAFSGLEEEARDELDWFGLLLRTPWVFADGAEFAVSPREEMLWNGRPMSRFRITGRRSARPDGYELWCEPDTGEPRMLVLHPADPQARACRVRLLDFRSFGNVRIPMRRVVEAADGGRRLEIEITDLQWGETFGPRHFAPPPR